MQVTTGNGSFAEGPALPRARPSAKTAFAESQQGHSAKSLCRRLNSRQSQALGKGQLCRESGSQQRQALGKGATPGTAPVVITFAESRAVRLSAKRRPLPSAWASTRQMSRGLKLGPGQQPLPSAGHSGSRQRAPLPRAFFEFWTQTFFCSPCILYTSTCSNLGAFYNILLYFIN
jgi:hypothetical protein